ncbi:5-formyltetrahydrofolate cyclo-ligase [Halobacillus yeomjeoni]|uniref:5-formyltetrahydrofolate cyclo-ligase n=1 Tax=Halobacillus yeomjeoni TaxID=311194 RepID=A0A931MV05_9BACI|nr:5-formyltetrahydrofolate cyclo-ligase [Halobacillus yeomjeoni]MBH0229876.1 5-formyltetrahydrofolate cyclo-ligase [Halobacillus yeomjeoni]
MTKKKLRMQAKDRLSKLTEVEKVQIEENIYTHLFNSTLWKEAETVGVTVSQDHEWSTYPIIERGWNEQKNVAVPKCDPSSKQMVFYQLKDYEQLETVYFGLKEPKPQATHPVHKTQVDLLLVPGLMFDENGYRIGYGGGFYDRYINGFEGVTVMIAGELQKIDAVPIDQYDKKVDYILTEKGFHKT